LRIDCLLGFGSCDNLLERFRKPDRQLGEHFAVERDLILFETGHQFGIRQIHFAGTGIDAHLPQPAKFSLSLLAADVRVLAGMHQGFIGCAEIGFAVTDETLGSFNYLFSAGSFLNAAFYSCHILACRD